MPDDRARADYIRRLVLASVPELSADEIADAFAGSDHADVWVNIIDAVAATLEELEGRLDALEQSLPRRLH